MHHPAVAVGNTHVIALHDLLPRQLQIFLNDTEFLPGAGCIFTDETSGSLCTGMGTGLGLLPELQIAVLQN